MKESIQERAYGLLKARMDNALNLMKEDFKDVSPFGKKPVSLDEQLYQYEQVKKSPQELMRMIDEQGEEKTNIWLGEMVKMRRNKNA